MAPEASDLGLGDASFDIQGITDADAGSAPLTDLSLAWRTALNPLIV